MTRLLLCTTAFCLLLLPGTLSAQKQHTPEGNVDSVAAATSPDVVPGLGTRIWYSLTNEASLSVSYGILEISLEIERKSDGAKATMVDRDETSLAVSYSTRPSFFENSNFGYTFMANYANFAMHVQELARNEHVNLGTKITGKVLYFVPTLYYQWGDHLLSRRFVRLGFGIGAGVANYTGTIQIASVADPFQVITVSRKSYDPRLTLSNFLEARWNHLGLSLSYASPRIYGDTYQVRVSDFSARIGYTYYF